MQDALMALKQVIANTQNIVEIPDIAAKKPEATK